jgi:NAD kinase
MNEQIEAFLALMGQKLAQLGGGGAVFSWLLSEKGIALFGISIGLAGLVMQYVFRHRQDVRDAAEESRQQAEHDRRMALYD